MGAIRQESSARDVPHGKERTELNNNNNRRMMYVDAIACVLYVGGMAVGTVGR